MRVDLFVLAMVETKDVYSHRGDPLVFSIVRGAGAAGDRMDGSAGLRVGAAAVRAGPTEPPMSSGWRTGAASARPSCSRRKSALYAGTGVPLASAAGSSS